MLESLRVGVELQNRPLGYAWIAPAGRQSLEGRIQICLMIIEFLK